MSEKLENAVKDFRNLMTSTSNLITMADAYIAHLDEQAALAVPYDWEWLAARPEFEKGDHGFIVTKTTALHARLCCKEYMVEGPSYHVVVWCVMDTAGEVIRIPAPATKGDVLKLLEVFS